jgi:hypothetical protein
LVTTGEERFGMMRVRSGEADRPLELHALQCEGRRIGVFTAGGESACFYFGSLSEEEIGGYE